ncbi:MAG: hypothetical protein PHV47_00680 [Candidatus Pacebacteria bacterium]|nr:hypothetical protein [Candidatus Paceibacterota bacterium]
MKKLYAKALSSGLALLSGFKGVSAQGINDPTVPSGEAVLRPNLNKFNNMFLVIIAIPLAVILIFSAKLIIKHFFRQRNIKRLITSIIPMIFYIATLVFAYFSLKRYLLTYGYSFTSASHIQTLFPILTIVFFLCAVITTIIAIKKNKN